MSVILSGLRVRQSFALQININSDVMVFTYEQGTNYLRPVRALINVIESVNCSPVYYWVLLGGLTDVLQLFSAEQQHHVFKPTHTVHHTVKQQAR
jgi:hypothetical protein